MKFIALSVLAAVTFSSPAFAHDGFYHGYNQGYEDGSRRDRAEERAQETDDVTSEDQVTQIAESALNQATVLENALNSTNPWAAEILIKPIKIRALFLYSSARGRGAVADPVRYKAMKLVDAIKNAEYFLMNVVTNDDGELLDAAQSLITAKDSLEHKFEF